MSDSTEKEEAPKKVRTEKQIAATEKMKHTRWKAKAGTLDLAESYDPDNIAIAELWYSNHELAKENRRKRKIDDIDRLINTRLDGFQTRILDEIQKPLSSFFDRYIEDYYEDSEPLQTPIAASPPHLDDIKQEEEERPVAVASRSRKSDYFKSTSTGHDFSRFF